MILQDISHTHFFKLIATLFIYLSIYLAVLGLVSCEGFLQLRQAGATLRCGARASHYRGLSCCRAQAPDAQAQQLWLTGLVAPLSQLFKSPLEALCPTRGDLCSHWLGTFQEKQGLCKCGCGSDRQQLGICSHRIAMAHHLSWRCDTVVINPQFIR